MIVACPSCHKKIKAPDSAAGKKAKCPSCGTVMMLPMPVQDAEVIRPNPTWTPPSSDPLSSLPGGGGLEDLLAEADQMYALEKKPAAASDPFAAGGASSATDSTVPRRPCPACGEMIIMSALKCRFCGEAFDPGLKRKQRRRGGHEDDELTPVEILLAVLCTNIACIFGIVWLVMGKPKGIKMIGLCVLVNVAWFVLWLILSALFQ